MERLFRLLATELKVKGIMKVEIIIPTCYATSVSQYCTEASDEIKAEFVEMISQDFDKKIEKMNVGESFEYRFSKDGPNPDLAEVLDKLPGGPYILRDDTVVRFEITEKDGEETRVRPGVSEWLWKLL